MAALLGLLPEKSFEQITVLEIATAAGVHRATFFRHFPTKEAILDHAATDEIRRLMDLTVPLIDHAGELSSVQALCDHIDRRRLLWTVLLTGGAAGTMRAEWLRVSREVAVHRAPTDSLIPISLAVKCSVGLILETIVWWLTQPAKVMDADRMALTLHHLLSGVQWLPERP